MAPGGFWFQDVLLQMDEDSFCPGSHRQQETHFKIKAQKGSTTSVFTSNIFQDNAIIIIVVVVVDGKFKVKKVFSAAEWGRWSWMLLRGMLAALCPGDKAFFLYVL
ncbi:hypothetical protein Q8A73_000015 [Channa argus]|nr:hypothetical protein Q8A73_000015 [Channa argus]